jgi:hypothetical protein
MMTKAIQVIADAPTETAARELLPAYTMQDGCIGARVIRANPHKGDGVWIPGGWLVQAFFPDAGPDGELPDGMRRVLVPDSLLASLAHN